MKKTFFTSFKAIILLGAMFLAGPVAAQEAVLEKAAEAWPMTLVLGVTVAGFLFLLLFIALLITFCQALPILYQFYDHPDRKNATMAKFMNLFRGNTQVLTGKAGDVLLEDHAYDGIHEFDNDLPPWWKAMFYATVFFGVVYLLNFHVLQSAPLQAAEYEAEMQHAALLKPKTGSDNANEKTDYKLITDKAQLEAGHTAYMQNCAACHGQNGEGVVGPNLTDEYWLHGGEVNAVFKTIKYGVTSKGMVAWQGKLSDDQILEISSYILSIQGSNPANAKGPQGMKIK